MAWVSPRTWTTGEIVTAAIMNTHVRDNFLETSPAKAAAAGDIFYATAANAIAALTGGIPLLGLYGVAGGAADVYTLTLSPAPTAYSAGMRITVKINLDNTGASTINVNSLGAKSIKKPNGNDLAAGNLQQDSVYTLVYNGTSFFLQGSDSAGDATASNVLSGKTFSNDTDTNLTGTMADNAGDVAAVSYHRDGTSLHIVPATGYTDGSDDASVITDADFVAGKIKLGEDVFGLTGTYNEIVFSAGDNVQILKTESTYNDTNVYAKRRQFTVQMPGTYRVVFTLASSSGALIYGRVYKNGAGYGTERSTTSGGVTYSEDLTFASGDTIEIWLKGVDGANTSIMYNAKLCTSEPGLFVLDL